MAMSEGKLITIIGPTASGKTGRAVALARRFDGEILSGDSRQVYCQMDLGTGKDIEEYGNVPYHLIDICSPGEKYNLHRFLKDFSVALSSVRAKNKMPILCGGSGMYVESALSGIALPDVPENEVLRSELSGKSLSELVEILKRYKTLHNTTDVDTVKRAIRAIEIEEYYINYPELANRADRSKSKPIESIIVGIDIPRDERRKRISERLERRIEAGMIDEIRGLLNEGISPEDLIYYGLEYKFLTLYVIGQLSFDEMKKQLEIAIHQFAKRQMTWFRGMEKRGFKINWLPFDMPDIEFADRVEEML